MATPTKPSSISEKHCSRSLQVVVLGTEVLIHMPWRKHGAPAYPQQKAAQSLPHAGKQGANVSKVAGAKSMTSDMEVSASEKVAAKHASLASMVRDTPTMPRASWPQICYCLLSRVAQGADDLTALDPCLTTGERMRQRPRHAALGPQRERSRRNRLAEGGSRCHRLVADVPGGRYAHARAFTSDRPRFVLAQLPESPFTFCIAVHVLTNDRTIVADGNAARDSANITVRGMGGEAIVLEDAPTFQPMPGMDEAAGNCLSVWLHVLFGGVFSLVVVNDPRAEVHVMRMASGKGESKRDPVVITGLQQLQVSTITETTDDAFAYSPGSSSSTETPKQQDSEVRLSMDEPYGPSPMQSFRATSSPSS